MNTDYSINTEISQVKILVLCHNTPYPPIHGGKLDMWNSLVLLSKAGARIQMISWDDKELNINNNNIILSVCEIHHLIKLSRKFLFRLKRAHLLLQNPWFANIRWPQKNQLVTISEETIRFDPDIIFLHGWYGALLAFHLHKKTKAPIFYRSHNIEFLYIKNQGRYAKSIRAKIVNLISCLHLKSFELKIINNSYINYYISDNDCNFFKRLGDQKGKTILPFIDLNEEILINETPEFNLSFMGNLNTLNNVNGIMWLITKVMPIVWKTRSSVNLIISGSNPPKKLIHEISKHGQIKLYENPPDSSLALSNGQIYLNPVESAGGIQLKNIEMAKHGRPMIARSNSLLGLPEKIKNLFIIADTPEQFAAAIINELTINRDHVNNIPILSEYFGESSALKIINDINYLKSKPD
ncbi:hypothetical protein B1757_10675 [Acidithiobacillus marinus]|uniref:Glycosyltransferase subfamily 4-like N-terminal domain-containing protein n=1 Tax=Acidithiobacillus marinus TaxID=187490 RepID=A0A2I1DJY2_9PROT|nr:glycosyltransferase [Acidithiobacillus marinus]PKY10179.1 hypothetical protein B1757_10675 [Acidithiobacillus marinus]